MFKHPVFLLLLAASCSALSNQGGVDSPSGAQTPLPGLGTIPSDPVSRIFTDGYIGAPATAGDSRLLSEKLDKSLWRVVSGTSYYFLMFHNESDGAFKYSQSPVISLRYTNTSGLNFRRGTIISNTDSILIIEWGEYIFGYALLPGDKLASRIEHFNTPAERQQNIDAMYSLLHTMVSQPGGIKTEWIFRRMTNASQYAPRSGDPNYEDYIYRYN